MLEAHDIEIARGNRRLFSGVSLSLVPGTLLLVTGSNGSGKTSLLRTLCGLLTPDAGEIHWQGENIHKLREEYWKQLVYIGHHNALKGELTTSENLAALCVLSGAEPRVEQRRLALAHFGLADREHLPIKVLSQGQRRRTALARLALSSAQPLWILDEPLAALDDSATTQARDLIGRHLAGGGIVVMTTHQDVQIPALSTTTLNLDQRSIP
jgi:heme exporter protein A